MPKNKIIQTHYNSISSINSCVRTNHFLLQLGQLWDIVGKLAIKVINHLQSLSHTLNGTDPVFTTPSTTSADLNENNHTNMAVLAHKALNGLSPQYLADNCQLITTTGRRRLRSSNVATCDVPRTRIILGDRSFTAAGPCLSNNLPLHLRDSELPLLEFRQLLKMHLSGWWSKCIVTYFIYSAFYKCTYLLTYVCGFVMPHDPTVSMKAIRFRAVHPSICSSVHRERSCYHDISWTAWAISMKLTRNIHYPATDGLVRFWTWEAEVKG